MLWFNKLSEYKPWFVHPKNRNWESQCLFKNVHNYANHADCDVTVLTCVIISMIDVKVFLIHFINIYSFIGFCFKEQAW